MTGSFPASAQRPTPQRALDPLTEALATGLGEPISSAVSFDEALEETAELVEEAQRGDRTRWALSRATDLAAQFPGHMILQRRVAELMAIAGDDQAALACWRGIAGRFPRAPDLFPGYAEILAKTVGQEGARQISLTYCADPGSAPPAADALRTARCLHFFGDPESALQSLDAITGDSPLFGDAVMERIAIYEGQGRLADILALAPAVRGNRRATEAIDRIGAARKHLPNGSQPDQPSIAALSALLEATVSGRGNPATGRANAIAMIGGTLGSGGAERQLVNTAIGLQSRHQGDIDAPGPVTVYCRKLDPRRGHDFYLPKLHEQGIDVIDYLRIVPWGGDQQHSILNGSTDLINLLPPRMREGVIQLTDMLRYQKPDIIQIWQDGMIFAAGLAALMAGIPRIVLNVRTMPPSERRDRLKPEQRVLYRGLLRASGVSLTTNSLAAARAYEAWLGLETDSVSMIANGVAPLPLTVTDAEQNSWYAFDQQTGPGFVFGGVMRLDDNKRPLEWIRMAIALAERLPDARFLLAGAGPLREAAQDLAERSGITGRLLLVGRSTHIGFWLSKMAALAVTSRHEGMPNVLIEAQLAGLPVLSTPAGGAAEALAPAAANLLLPDIEPVAHDVAADHLARLAMRDAAEVAADGAALTRWAENQFGVDAMIDRTMQLFNQN